MGQDQRIRSGQAAFAKGFVVPVVLLAGAQAWFVAAHVRSDTLASPAAVAVAFVAALRDGSLLQATGQTLLAAFGGLAIGGGIGLLVGFLLGLFKILDRLLEVTVESLRPIPAVALIPLAILLFGFGYRLEMTCVAFSCAWTMLILTRGAVAGVEIRLLEVSDALRFNLFDKIVKFVLPAALPRVFVAFRLATSLSLIVAVTTEIAANPIGLGYGMIIAEQTLHPEVMLAFLVWIGLLGWVLNQALLFMQRTCFGRAALGEGSC